MQFGDTIAALSSGGGPAARAIVRLSGPGAIELAGSLCDGGKLEHLAAIRTRVKVLGHKVPAWIYCFLGPASYTGEDVVELHLPGNALLARLVLDELLRRGARQAEAGEFSARAYFNGRMDLTEAEGVAAIVGAHGERELAAARQLLAGELARRLKPIMDQLGETLALVEVGIDFSEEDVTFLSAGQLCQRVEEIDGALERLVNESARFERLSHEPRIALAGRPNAGKSTLLNALAGVERAVVSSVAGTTRDVIWAEAALAHGMVRIVDAAGLEENPPSQDDSPHATIARRMHEQSVRAIESADRVVLVHDSTDDRPMLDLPRRPDLVVLSKSDLMPPRTRDAHLAVSAMTGKGMQELRRKLDELAFGQGDGGSALALNQRHLRAIDDARAALGRARKEAQAGAEVVALELREALDALGRILGAVTPEDVLSRVFATFCIGK